MIWVKAEQDYDLLNFVEDTKVVGCVRYMKGSKRFMASTQEHYLGQYKTLKNAQLAVETKRNTECKDEGVII